ncbi:MAG: hypothetical protein CVT60_02205 [Actinobacteria bacterium HGW-Actinobacteria-10]|jgi:hypothetical protein|nr:MAG: hypothetical protein CVT60_02205 [Actinobacteria bacterium HGW-Actinobacteria-10]
MSKRCELKAHNGIDGLCGEADCPFWRVADYLHIAHAPSDGCAIQFFELLGERGSEISKWLLTVKERVEAQKTAQARGAEAHDEPEDALSQ